MKSTHNPSIGPMQSSKFHHNLPVPKVVAVAYQFKTTTTPFIMILNKHCNLQLASNNSWRILENYDITCHVGKH